MKATIIKSLRERKARQVAEMVSSSSRGEVPLTALNPAPPPSTSSSTTIASTSFYVPPARSVSAPTPRRCPRPSSRGWPASKMESWQEPSSSSIDVLIHFSLFPFMNHATSVFPPHFVFSVWTELIIVCSLLSPLLRLYRSQESRLFSNITECEWLPALFLVPSFPIQTHAPFSPVRKYT
jgi:hypothetical protein